jgi:hypothetical protein
MNTLRTMTMAVAMSLFSSLPAFAVDTAKTYSSGVLIAVFMAFCAVLVLAQLVPSIMLLIGFIRGLVHRTESKA